MRQVRVERRQLLFGGLSGEPHVARLVLPAEARRTASGVLRLEHHQRSPETVWLCQAWLTVVGMMARFAEVDVT